MLVITDKDQIGEAQEDVLHPETKQVIGKKVRRYPLKEPTLDVTEAQIGRAPVEQTNILKNDLDSICMHHGDFLCAIDAATLERVAEHLLTLGGTLGVVGRSFQIRIRAYRRLLALLPDNAQVTLEVLEADKRPVAATADHFEIRRVERVDVKTDRETSLILLHDPGHSLDERILREQFGY